ncbi:MAG: hypothetical protein ACK2UL_08035 [Anaerolineae bacterium]
MLALRLIAALAGAALVLAAVRSALQSFVLARAAPEHITDAVFRVSRAAFRLRESRATTYEDLDRLMALYAPVTLMLIPLAWAACVLLGYMLVFWAMGVTPLYAAFRLSGSSLLTLGFESVEAPWVTALVFSEAIIGLGVIALLIAYLPAMYAAFARRSALVGMLEVRAGSPPTGVELLERAHRLEMVEQLEMQMVGSLDELFRRWEVWFAEVEESHTSLAALVFFRSPQPHQSWITAAGAVLDGAALLASTVDAPRTPSAELCIRGGYIALRQIAGYFDVEYDPDPRPTDPISIHRTEFDQAYDRLLRSGLPLRQDRDQCWRDFAGWRVNYDVPLLALASLTRAPYAPWSSDRCACSALVTGGRP